MEERQAGGDPLDAPNLPHIHFGGRWCGIGNWTDDDSNLSTSCNDTAKEVP